MPVCLLPHITINPIKEACLSILKPLMTVWISHKFLYNVPCRTGVDIDNKTVKDLSVLKNIIGIKDATGEMDRLDDLKNKCI